MSLSGDIISASDKTSTQIWPSWSVRRSDAHIPAANQTSVRMVCAFGKAFRPAGWWLTPVGPAQEMLVRQEKWKCGVLTRQTQRPTQGTGSKVKSALEGKCYPRQTVGPSRRGERRHRKASQRRRHRSPTWAREMNRPISVGRSLVRRF
jgi:hypothetical protein